ncbi:structural maintenance of chromosomes protein 2 [Schistocerca cancellata]|uniref:structural maintenance of chromosomes protein 2 n=1 Tax=Schistocerca cancellata TaxID=274614 RepID=UPI002117D68E|nr:structural maintenance of chromosomes protein 2 [Schistocerca cancellata]
MYVKSIILDGFKSYGKRTEIHGFDPLFNAITGLNGSGKSNILDAICFVLGISNLTNVRATSLQELVYKNGQAGVSKASVSVIFDNRDSKSSPIGYEQYEEIAVTRQVVVGGKNKYLINGTNVQAKRVNDLFCSVQLNVNNPHFLIMQGRITKVLNMKPMEILAMVEEAAGTKMYENKKIAAEKTIEKKDNKLRQLNDIINSDIAPKIQKLKEEQGRYLEYQKVVRDLERLMKIYVAWRYMKAKEKVKEVQDASRNVDTEIQEAEVAVKESEAEAAGIDGKVAEMQEMIDSMSRARLKDQEIALNKMEKEEAVISAKVKMSKEAVNKEISKKNRLEKALKEEEATLARKEKEIVTKGQALEKMREECEKDNKALEDAQRRFQAASAGMVADENGVATTLQEQLIQVKQELAQARTDVQNSTRQIQHFKKILPPKESELKTTERDYNTRKQEFTKVEKEIKAVEEEMKKLDYEDGYLERLITEKRQLEGLLRQMRAKVERLESRYPYLFFEYTDPEPNFNKKSIIGMVARLVKIKDMSKAMALEAAAGGRLYNIVIDNEVTGRKLLENGDLPRRTTFVPLNRIIGRALEPKYVKAAEKLVGKENIVPAIHLVEFDDKYRVVLQYVFGETMITNNMDMAREVTFNENIKKKCVTLEGDIFDPAGVLQGGAPSTSTPVLSQLEEIFAMVDDFEDKKQKLREMEEKIKRVSEVARCYDSYKQQLEVKTHKLSLLQNQLEHTAHHRLMQEIEQIKADIKELEEKVEKCKQIEKDGAKKVKDLEYQVEHAKEVIEKERKNAEKDMTRLKTKSEATQEKWQKLQQDYETLEMEISELKSSLETSKQELIDISGEITKLEEAHQALESELKSVKEVVTEKKNALSEVKKEISLKNQDIQALTKHKADLQKRVGDLQLKIKKLGLDKKKFETEATDNEKQVAKIIEENEWIPDEEKFFGQPKGAYDYNSMDMKQACKTINTLEERKEELGRRLNIRAMNMLDKEEEQYNDLIQKKQIVENDRAKIMLVLQELDEKKKQALRQAWTQVNKDFGSIFTTLLPGAQACLQPPKGKDVLDGLEVKVGFGGLWKEGLQELSGGQRSLVALSLILAMLLFKPAPIYILDEVDAALDLSHTQNIGTMLRTHFKHSQFIVVSLKDGMFENANVLFRTQFVDGMSTVRRIAQNPSNVDRASEEGPSKRKKK